MTVRSSPARPGPGSSRFGRGLGTGTLGEGAEVLQNPFSLSGGLCVIRLGLVECLTRTPSYSRPTRKFRRGVKIRRELRTALSPAYPEIARQRSYRTWRSSSLAPPETTEVIQDEGRVLNSIISFFLKARTRLDLSVSYVPSRTGAEFVGALVKAKERGVRPRLVTDVTRENIRDLRSASDYLEVRHITGLRGNSWGVSDSEYLSSLATEEFRAALPLVYSNAESLVAEHQSIFDALWERGTTLRERGASLESGVELPELEIIRDPRRTKRIYLAMAKGAKKEVRLLFPTAAAFHRDDATGVITALEELASSGVRVRLLVPVDLKVLARLPGQGVKQSRRIAFRPILRSDAKETVTVLVVDDSASLTIDERDPSQERFESAFGSAVVATREPRVRQNLRLFDRIWDEAELHDAERRAREREEVSRKKAELMQDILTHDISNFNQVARLNAELLGERLRGREAAARISAILRAVDGSTELIDRAKKLGSIMAAKGVRLHATSLRASLARSVLLARRATPGVRLEIEGRLHGEVLADELLDEVFVNLISNSVKYTQGTRVVVSVRQDATRLPGKPDGRPCRAWKVSISDRGRGIPDGQKEGAFRRYLETAKGSGLGLSIVHALVTERYGGSAAIRNRVSGDFRKGTTVEICLPRP